MVTKSTNYLEFCVVPLTTEGMQNNLRNLGSPAQSLEALYAFCVISFDSIMRFQAGLVKLRGEIAINIGLIPPRFVRYYKLHEVVELMEKAKWLEKKIGSPTPTESAQMHTRALEAEYNLALRRDEIDTWHTFAMQNGTPDGFSAAMRIGAYERAKQSIQNTSR